jgi:hypothetical protein
MTSNGRRIGVVAAWSAAAVLGLGAAGGAATVAFADPTPSPSASGSAAPKADRPDRPGKGLRGLGRHGDGFGARGIGGRGLHGEFVVKDADGKFVTRLSQQGKVTAVDSGSITLKSEDGFTKTYKLNGDTKINRNHEEAKVADIKVGDNAAVVALKSGDDATAQRVVTHVPATN